MLQTKLTNFLNSCVLVVQRAIFKETEGVITNENKTISPDLCILERPDGC